MKIFFFWNTWDNPAKAFYRVLLLIFFISILVYAFTYFMGSSYIISWEIETSVNPVKTLFDTYRLGIFEFPITIENYIISQGFVASELQVNEWPAYLLLVWLGVFISIMLALMSGLTRFWFFIANGIVAALFVGLKLDHLLLFNSYEKIGLVIAFILYLPSLYYFYFINKEVGFVTRFITHFIATFIFGIIIYFFSNVEFPFLHLANYGIYVPLILSIFFAFMVGHEIITSLLRIITSGALIGDKNSLVHFLIISIVFLLNVLMVLLINTKIIETNLYLIGSFGLLTIASLLGIWGYKTKESTYQSIYSFYPFGAFMYIGMAITAHFAIAYFFVSGNDSFVEVMEDVIIYSQLGFSTMFVIYVIANFFELLRNNANVGKVLYKPMKMPFFLSRFAGIVMVLALFFRFNMIAYYQSVAGFYSGIGDLYLKVDDYLSAAEYYKLANIYSGTSHRANYALATLEKRNENSEQELDYLKQAVGKNPTEFAYANLASKLMDNKRYFETIFTLQDGLEHFPNNGNLLNNLGLAYMEIDQVDSAFYYLERSVNDSNTKNEAATNIFALLRLKGFTIKSDTLEYLVKKSNYIAATNNLVVLANDLKRTSNDNEKIQFGDPENEKVEQLIYNYNKALNEPSLVDTTYLQQTKSFYDSSDGSWFQDNINMANALALYRKGELTTSFNMLNQLAIQNPEKSYYSLLGKLAFSQRANGLAVDYFKSAFQNGRLEIAPELAFSYMEIGELGKASFIWEQILQIGDTINLSMARKMIKVIKAENIEEILNEDTETKFSFLAYRYREFDLEKLKRIVLDINNEDAQALGFLRLFDAYLELNQNQKASELLQQVGKLNISRDDVLDEINLAQCKYAYHLNDSEMMQRLHNNLKSDNRIVKNYLKLFKNLEQIKISQKEETVSDFKKMGFNNPFFEPGVFESVQFFNDITGDPDMAYEVLINAVSINPFSVELNKAYALQCLKVGLKSYAFDTKEELRKMIPSVTFELFEKDFETALKEYETNSADW